MAPLSTMTTPAPMLFSGPFFAPSSLGPPRTCTTEGRMAAWALAARDGRGLVASAGSTAASMSSWVILPGRVRSASRPPSRDEQAAAQPEPAPPGAPEARRRRGRSAAPRRKEPGPRDGDGPGRADRSGPVGPRRRALL
jgi:hypothetical protein